MKLVTKLGLSALAASAIATGGVVVTPTAAAAPIGVTPAPAVVAAPGVTEYWEVRLDPGTTRLFATPGVSEAAADARLAAVGLHLPKDIQKAAFLASVASRASKWAGTFGADACVSSKVPTTNDKQHSYAVSTVHQSCPWQTPSVRKVH